eukprot:scaffold25698_cov35-Phaeocystis_antarctica.AAC.2
MSLSNRRTMTFGSAGCRAPCNHRAAEAPPSHLGRSAWCHGARAVVAPARGRSGSYPQGKRPLSAAYPRLEIGALLGNLRLPEDSGAMPMMGRRWPKLPEVGAANLRPRPLRKRACVRPPL